MYKKSRAFTSILLVLLLTGACQKNPDTKYRTSPLRIAVAANVQFAMEDIEALFESETGSPIEIIISSSGKLAAQIMEGAPFDLFLSADMKYADSLYSRQMAIHSPLVYAYGSLVVWTFEPYKLDELQTLLSDEQQIHKIAIANPANAPYGLQTLNFFKNTGILESVKPRLVYGESIAQTNQYIHTRVVNLGFTAKSIVLSPEMSGKGTWTDIDPALYEPIAQGVVITRHGKENQPELSKQFLSFLFSDPVQAIFKKYGYEVSDSKPALPY